MVESNNFIFVGRKEEFSILQSAVDSADGRSGQIVTIAGEAGAGKTRIAIEATEYAKTLGHLVVTGQCREIRGAPAYWPWSQILRQISANSGLAIPEEYLAFVDKPVIRTSGGPEHQAQAFLAHESISRFLTKAALQKPILILIEDIHWADGSSLSALEFVAGDIDTSRITLLVTQRTPEDTPDSVLSTLGEISRQHNHNSVRLQPFQEHSVGKLLNQLEKDFADSNVIEQVLKKTGGNALYVTELIRLIADSPLSESGQLVENLGVPEPVDNFLATRSSSLPSETIELLEIAAVLGRNIDPKDVAELAGINRYAFTKRIEPAITAGLVGYTKELGLSLQFSHELVRMAFVERLDSVRNAELNFAAATLREQVTDNELPALAGILAHHYELAAPLVGDKPTIEYQILAGEFANSRLSSPEARYYLEKAVEKLIPGLVGKVNQLTLIPYQNIPVSPLDISKLTEQGERCLRAYALSLAGGFDEYHSSIVNKAAFDYLVDHGRTSEATQMATISHSIHNRITRDMYQTALEISEPGEPQRVSLLSKWAVQLGRNPDRDYEQAIDFHLKAIEEAERLGDPLHIAWSTGRLAMSHIWHGRWSEGIAQATKAAAFSEKTDDLECQVHCYVWSVIALITVGDKEAAKEFADKAVKTADRTRHKLRLSQAHRMQALVDFHSGQLKSAADNLRSAVDIVHSGSVLTNLATINANLGLGDEVETLVELILERNRNSMNGFDPELKIGPALAMLAVDTGTKITAVSDLKRMFIPNQDVLTIPLLSIPWWVGKGYFGILTDDSDLVQEVYDRQLPNAGIITPNVVAFCASVDRSLGKFAEFLGENHKAIRHYEDAVKFLRYRDYKFELAWACHDHSRLLIELNEYAQADKLIAEGLAIAEQCELVLLAGNLIHLREIVREKLEKTKPFGLTRRELDVLELLAAGLANREIAKRLFVTENTVRTHAQSIYSKTGTSGRSAATRFAIEHRLVSALD